MLGQNLATPVPGSFPQKREEHAQRRGACPGLSTPMPTGDGLLVRLVPTGTIALDAFAALWSSERVAVGKALLLPAAPPVDSCGLRMEMVE